MKALYNIINDIYFWCSCLKNSTITQIKHYKKHRKFLKKSDVVIPPNISKEFASSLQDCHIGWAGQSLEIKKAMGKFPFKRYRKKLDHERYLEYLELKEFQDDHDEEYVIWKMKRNNNDDY